MSAYELRHLRYLLAVVEHGNFTRAAEDLHVSQPTLSHQIRQLERLLGVQLLDRTGRSVRLTDAGGVYAEHARRALRDLAAAERAVHDVRDLSRGQVRLAVTPTLTGYLIGPLAAAMGSAHPGIDLALTEATQDRIEALLLADGLDLGIAFEGPYAAGVTATPLFTETLNLVTRADFRPSPAGPLPVREIGRLRLALLGTDFATRKQVDAYFADCGVTPRVAVDTDSVHALTEIVRRTDLATVLPDALTRENPGLVSTPMRPMIPARTVTLLRRADAFESAAEGAFTEVLHGHVRERGYAPAG